MIATTDFFNQIILIIIKISQNLVLKFRQTIRDIKLLISLIYYFKKLVN